MSFGFYLHILGLWIICGPNLDFPILVDVVLVDLLLGPGLPHCLGQLGPLVGELEVDEQVYTFLNVLASVRVLASHHPLS